MNIEDKQPDCDAVLNKREEQCASLNKVSDRDYQYIEKSCRKRPPGGNSMYSSTKTSDTSHTTTTSFLTQKSSHHPTTGQKQDNRFMMNGAQMNNRQWKLDSTTKNNIESHKRKLKDDGVLLDDKKVEKPLERSEMVSNNKNRLLTFHQIPIHLRFNRFVLSHYRTPTDWKGCIKSLGYMHNETINILTHAIPFICILASIPWLLPYESISIPYLPTFHVIASLAPWIGSIVYHLFMNHEKGYSVYEAVLTIDLLGIWTTQTTGGLITICATIYCFDNEVQEQLLTAYGFLSLYCLYKAMTAKGPWDRRFAFTAPFMVRMSMAFLRFIGKGGGNQLSFTHVILQDLIAVLGAIIGATNVPERWFPPGALDLFCNSHHVMHVLVVYAVYHMHTAAVLDLTWMSDIKDDKLTCSSDISALPTVKELFGGYI